MKNWPKKRIKLHLTLLGFMIIIFIISDLLLGMFSIKSIVRLLFWFTTTEFILWGERCVRETDNEHKRLAEMKEEYRQNFPDDPNMEKPISIIGDNCYQQFKKWLDNLTPEEREQIKKEIEDESE